MKKFYNATYDLIFKKMFCTNNNYYLKRLLSEILRTDVYEVEILNGELVPDNTNIKHKEVDLLVKTNEGYINLEINTFPHGYTKEVRIRNMLYLFGNIKSGESHEKLSDYIQINLTLNNEECPLRSEYRIQNEYGDIWIDKIRIIEINLLKLLKKIREDDEIQVEYRYASLVCLEKEDFERYKDRDEEIEKFFGILQDTNEDNNLLNKVDYEEEQKSWEATFMYHGSNQKSIEIACNMLNNNYDIEEISKITGLSISEIEKIK